jgi:hypothetical protein
VTETLGVQYLGGPTAILEIGGVRMLTDPTFDLPGEYPIGERVLTKTHVPAIGRMNWDASMPSCSRTTSIQTTSTGSGASA